MSSNKAGRSSHGMKSQADVLMRGWWTTNSQRTEKKQETSSARNAGPFSLKTMKVPKLGFSFLETRIFRSQAYGSFHFLRS